MSIKEGIDQLVDSFVEEGTNKGYKGNKLNCYVRQQVKNLITKINSDVNHH